MRKHCEDRAAQNQTLASDSAAGYLLELWRVLQTSGRGEDNRHAVKLWTSFLVIVVAVAAITFRCQGLGRSIWLDEAWLANAVAAKSLRGMFYYDTWLQTSPPLFVLLVRGAAGGLGLNCWALRLVPWLAGLISTGLMFLLARRVLQGGFAHLAWTLMAMSPLAIYYSKALKPYSMELVVSAAAFLACLRYLDRPTNRRFCVLLASAVVSPLASYSAVFVLPQFLLAVLLAGKRRLARAALLAVAGTVMLAAVYFVFAAPNTTPSLRSFWMQDGRGYGSLWRAGNGAYGLLGGLPIPGRLLARRGPVGAAAGLLVSAGFVLAGLRFRKGRRRRLEVLLLCALPCLMLTVVSSGRWYPMRDRTTLFLLPAVIVLLISSAQGIAHLLLLRLPRNIGTLLPDAALAGSIVLALWVGTGRQIAWIGSSPEEDVAGAMRFLHSYAKSDDVLWVHASCSESFKAYEQMRGPLRASVRFGRTGWPCCPRGIPVLPRSGDEVETRADLDAAVPAGVAGRVWLLYTKRPEHWRFVGLDESRVVESVFRARACRQEATPPFQNIGITLFACGASRD